MIKNFIDKLLGKKTGTAKRSLFGKRRDVMADEHKIDPALVDERAATVVRTLKQAGFEVAEAATAAPAGTVDATGAAVGPGTVWSQTPGPGAAPPEDRTVEIRVEPAASTEQPPTCNDSAGLAPAGC